MDGNKPGLKRLYDWLAGALVSVLPFFSLWLLWFPPEKGRWYLGGDFIEHIGSRSAFYQALSEGRFPLWDHLHHTGLPFLSYLFDLFNPVILLYVFNLEDGYLRNGPMQIMMVGHFAIAALGAYLWGQSLKLGRTAAMVMGICWSLNGFFLVKASGHDLVIHTIAWIPFVFLFLDRARQKGSALSGAWAGFFLAMTFLGGHPQFFYYVALALLAHVIFWAVVLCRKQGIKKSWPLLWRMYLPLGVTAALIAAPQIAHLAGNLLGGLAAVHPSFDSGDLVFTQRGSGELMRLTQYFVPLLFPRASETFAGVGTIPLVAALIAIYRLRGPAQGCWKLIIIIATVLMLGGNMGLHKVLLDLLPGMAFFRETRRFAMLIHLALTALAGYGLFWLLETKPAPETKGVRRLVLTLSVMLGSALLLAISAQAAGLRLPEAGMVLRGLSAATLLFGLSWLVLWWVEQDRRGLMLKVFVVTIVALELAFLQIPHTVHEAKHFSPDPSKVPLQELARAENLAALAKDGKKRLWLKQNALHKSAAYRAGVMMMGEMPPHVERIFPRGFWQIMWRMEENPRFLDLFGVAYLDRSLPMAHSQRGSWKVVGYSQAAARLEKPTAALEVSFRAGAAFTQGLKPGDKIADICLLDAGVAAASIPLRLGPDTSGAVIEHKLETPVSCDEVLIASCQPRALAVIKEIKINGRRVYDRVQLNPAVDGLLGNPNALPLVYFVSRAAVVGPKAEYLDALASVDPSRSVIFRRKPPGWHAPTEPCPRPQGQAKMLSFSPQRVKVGVTAERQGYLVMGQNAFPGWKAELDGKPVPMLRAYGFLCAVEVPPGQHQVVFSYAEPLVWVGLALSLAALLVLLLWSLAGPVFRRRRRKKPQES